MKTADDYARVATQGAQLADEMIPATDQMEYPGPQATATAGCWRRAGYWCRPTWPKRPIAVIGNLAWHQDRGPHPFVFLVLVWT